MSPFLRYILSSIFSTLFFSLFFSYLIMQIISFNVLGRGNRKGMLKELFKNKDMLCLFLFIYFTFAVFFITVIQRECTYAPLANVFRGWSIYNDNHAIDYQVIGNILMFIPSSFLLCILMREEGSFVKIILKALLSSLCFSATGQARMGVAGNIREHALEISPDTHGRIGRSPEKPQIFL